VKATLSEKDINDWLDQHIRSRIYATLARPAWFRKWAETTQPAELQQDLHFILQASWEGRHAALRWLIEFVGIKLDGKTGKAARPKPQQHDFRITDLGGDFVPLSSKEAVELAKLWSDLTKVTSHATHASGHGAINEERLGLAIRFLIKFINDKVYVPRGRNL
jgi:hypothetical protein